MNNTFRELSDELDVKYAEAEAAVMKIMADHGFAKIGGGAPAKDMSFALTGKHDYYRWSKEYDKLISSIHFMFYMADPDKKVIDSITKTLEKEGFPANVRGTGNEVSTMWVIASMSAEIK